MLRYMQGKRKLRISVVGLVDIVFILLIFFALESNFLRIRALAFETPSAHRSPSQAVEPKKVTIELFRDKLIWVVGDTVALQQLGNYLITQKYTTETRILLLAEPGVHLQFIISVMDSLHARGFDKIQIQELD